MNEQNEAMDYARVKDIVTELDPELDRGDEGFRVAAVMLSALEVGNDRFALAAFTGEHVEWIAEISERLHASGIWTDDGKTNCDWLDEETGGISFWVDVLCGQGLLERSSE